MQNLTKDGNCVQQRSSNRAETEDGSDRKRRQPKRADEAVLLLTDPVVGCKDCGKAFVRPTICFFSSISRASMKYGFHTT